jgi:hypothetical protein
LVSGRNAFLVVNLVCLTAFTASFGQAARVTAFPSGVLT